MSARLSANAALIALIALSFVSFAGFEYDSNSLIAGAALFVLALIKVNLVFGSFMHLEWGHRPFRQVLLGWTALVLVILCGGLLLLPWETMDV